MEVPTSMEEGMVSLKTKQWKLKNESYKKAEICGQKWNNGQSYSALWKTINTCSTVFKCERDEQG